ncbi:hypothetical protein GCM10010168_30940 [Actinoplanes ianthinogenes]|uniref:Uncharacterized protein n=1 Tax=Actinoplanes ianthinogenes TaxID=122358 RepID=A0ABM7LLU3_9ACTN|nr:hypothetical protein [Actinoplanes ianthinogenes]BCJ40236.1 hypothetical protein Aiant_08930 [Actinoplanes ianthinogenes]GGR11128.1 hypothetical protein GCM10010168_30940 [Actinoplanes ianthinogenes]
MAAPVKPRRWLTLSAIAVVLILVVGGVVLFVTRDKTGADAVGAASDRLYDQSAVAVDISYANPDGESISGSFTLDDDLHATGTITDPLAGSAELVEYTAYSAVRGDVDWWSRRDADQARTLQKQWIDPTVAPFPVEITGNFGPTALGAFLLDVQDHGTEIAVDEPFRGRRVTGMTWEGWTVLVTVESPQRLVWFGGPISKDGPFKPADDPFPPVKPSSISVTVDDAPEDAAQAVQREVAAVIPEAAKSGSGAAPKKPPAQGSTFVPPGKGGPSAALADRLRSRGIEITTALSLDSGHGEQTTIAYRALDVMSARPGFQADDVLTAVENTYRRGLLPELQTLTQSGRLDNPQDLTDTLNHLDFEHDIGAAPSQRDKGQVGYRHEVELAATTLRADPQARVLLNGVKQAGGRRYHVDLLVERTAGTEAIQVKTVSDDQLIANLGSALRQLNGRNRDAATEQAPPGSKRIAQIYLEPAAGPVHAADRAGLERVLGGSDRNTVLSDWCVSGAAQADEVRIVNQLGVQQWTKDQMTALLGATGQCG